jgi:hypothetical protein
MEKNALVLFWLNIQADLNDTSNGEYLVNK